jgi:hypothetical protein
MAVTEASSSASDATARVELSGILAEFRATLKDEVDAFRRTASPSTDDDGQEDR